MPQRETGISDGRVCLGVIVGAHGVRGQVKIKSFAEEPGDVAAYGPLADESGTRTFTVKVTGRAKGTVVARIDGVSDRDQALALRGTQLFVDRGVLPEPEAESFYHADLIGLAAEDKDGRPLGRVVAVQNYGAGDLLEVAAPDGSSELFAFTRNVVPVVDLGGGRVIIAVPDERVADPKDAG